MCLLHFFGNELKFPEEQIQCEIFSEEKKVPKQMHPFVTFFFLL